MDKSKKADDALLTLLYKAKHELYLSDEELLKLPSVKVILKNNSRSNGVNIFIGSLLFLSLIALPTSIVLALTKGTGTGYFFAKTVLGLLGSKRGVDNLTCLVPNIEIVADKFRPPIDCSQCSSVKGVKRIKNLSQDDFVEHYAFSMQPILVEDGQELWTATDTFNYNFFKTVYNNSEILEKIEENCQFFPYQTNIDTLADFFNMSKNRVEGKEEPWYVGWSNCVGKTANQLREHYKVPYFLPPYLDQSNIDWIFMGLPGWGAHMHIDNVGTLSWQAQIKGTKKWTLQSPSECYSQCIEEMDIIVKPGEIIVLDTNKWFHATEIIGNETSIVIGSEYY